MFSTEKVLLRKTFERNIDERWYKRVVATASITQYQQQAPSFTLKCNMYPNRGPNTEPTSCGPCEAKEARKYFPKLERYVKWHLTSTEGPLFYIPNALFWAGFGNGEINADHFKNTIKFGTVTVDHEIDKRYTLLDVTRSSLVRYLQWRKPWLMREFYKDMSELFEVDVLMYIARRS